MQITLTLGERVGREAARLAAEDRVPLAEFCARALEAHVKQASQQRALEQIDALLGQGPVRDRLTHPHRA
jgi:hypothetical protein